MIAKTFIHVMLGAVSLLFAGIAAAPWIVDPLDYIAPRETAAADGQRSQPLGPPSLDAPSLESLSEIVERPLFTATRRPAPPAQPAPAKAAAEALDKSLILGRYKLTGIIVTPALRMVFVTVPGSRKTIAVARGKLLDGWVVSEVERQVIVLVSGERRKRIKIGDDATIEILSE